MEQLLPLLDSKWAHLATMAVVLLGILGRIYKAVVNGGGLVSIWHALLYGTNTPRGTAAPPQTETRQD